MAYRDKDKEREQNRLTAKIKRWREQGKDVSELLSQREALKVNNIVDVTNIGREKPKIIVGTSDFKKLVVESEVIVDKSLLIKAIFESPAEVLLITRPRRWGKSLNLRMLKYFFEIEVDDQGRLLSPSEQKNPQLFTELDISQDQKTMKELGQYPVILFSLKNTKGNNYREIVNNLNQKIQETYRLHAYLGYSEQLEVFDKKKFRDYCQGKINSADLQSSLSFLSELLAKHFKKPVLVLIDEYDETINASYVKFGYGTEEFEQVLDIIRGMLSAVLKDNPYLKKGVLTGILRIAKANLFSGLNNVEEYTLLNSEFGEFYGFTQKEVNQLLKRFFPGVNYRKIKEWYNGYNFGGQTVYNPYSLMSYLARKDEVSQHWTESGSMDLLEKALLNDEIQEQIQQLVKDKTIVSPIETQISFGAFKQPETLFSLLLFSGYLSPVTRSAQTDAYELAIPNQEIKKIYEKRIIKWVEHQSQISLYQYYSLVNLLPKKNILEFVQQLREFLLEATSFLQTGQKQAESFYNSFVLGLIHILRPTYLITSEQESGQGRADLILIPKSKPLHHAFIIEYKACDREEELDLTAQKGLKQIKNKKYNVKVREHPRVQEIFNLSLAFWKKQVQAKCEVERKISQNNWETETLI